MPLTTHTHAALQHLHKLIEVLPTLQHLHKLTAVSAANTHTQTHTHTHTHWTKLPPEPTTTYFTTPL